MSGTPSHGYCCPVCVHCNYPFDVYLGFQVWLLWRKLWWPHLQVYQCTYFSCLLGRCLEVELMGHGLDLFHFLSSCFQRGHPVLQDHWQCLSPAAPQPCKHAGALSVFLIADIPVGLKKYLIMLLLAIPWWQIMLHIFHVLAICVSSFVKCLFMYLSTYAGTCVEKISFPHGNAFVTLSKNNWLCTKSWLFFIFYSISWIYLSILMLVPYYFYSSNFKKSLNQIASTPTFLFFFKVVLDI